MAPGEQLLGLTATDARRLSKLLREYEAGAFGRPVLAAPQQLEQQQAKIAFINESDEEVPAFAICEITGAQAPSDEEPWALKIDKPSSTFRRLYLVNGERPVPATENGADGRGTGTLLRHARLVSYNSASGTPAYGEVWGPKPDQWTLEKYRFGFYMFGGAAEVGDLHLAVATQEMVTSVRGKTTGSVSKGSTGTVDVYDSAAATMSMTITGVKNVYGSTIGSGKWVNVTWNGTNPEMTAAEC